MLKSLLAIIAMFSSYLIFAQSNHVNVIPPSPTAIALQQYGNTNVSLYTGAVNVSIPIHTIKLKELELPITLNYKGSGGIQVQEIASWVGLGWTLNANGVISRTIIGLADDKCNNSKLGYIFCPEIPPYNAENYNAYVNYMDGLTDAEPDKYFFSVNGISGTFYIDKTKTVIQVPQTNHKIIPEFENPTGNSRIIGFKLINDQGITYKFNELEEVRSRQINGTITENAYDVSSWYLTYIENSNKTERIQFHYVQNSYTQYSEAVMNNFFFETPQGDFKPSYFSTETIGKRLSSITYQSDTIEFIAGNISRCDFLGETILEKIIIKEGSTIRNVEFHYSYLTGNEVVSLSTPCNTYNPKLAPLTDGDANKRLKLDSVHFYNASQSGYLPYRFSYNTAQKLPSRFSYARDHWGFYNGQIGNPDLQPKMVADYRPTAFNAIDFKILGKANRNPSEEHTKSGVLEKIVYPTGGWTEFNYELHRSSYKWLWNDKQPFKIDLNDGLVTSDTLNIFAVVDPVVEVLISIVGTTLSDQCDIEINLRNIQNNEVKSISNFYQYEISTGKYEQSLLLESGNYEVTYVEHDYQGTCMLESFNITVKWENELNNFNKRAGGLRIKQIIDRSNQYDSIVKNYFYRTQADSSVSSGALISLPRYGFYHQVDSYAYPVIDTYVPSYNSTLPLTMTQGSHVGYRRVEVHSQSPQKSGKTVYYYSSPAEIPDFIGGWVWTKYDKVVQLQNGKIEYQYIMPQIDSRDWLRGLLYAQVDYKYKNNAYEKIKSTTYYYNIYGDYSSIEQGILPEYPQVFNQDEFTTPQFISLSTSENVQPKLLGATTKRIQFSETQTNEYRTYYEYFTGRYEVAKKVDQVFSGGNMLNTITKYFYDNDEFHYPTQEYTVTSGSDTVFTNFFYSYNYNTISGLASEQIDALKSLKSKNVIADAIGITTFKGLALLSTTRKDYIKDAIDTSKVYSKAIYSAVGNSPLEQEVEFLKYAQDNLVEYRTRAGETVALVWGYNNRYPVAKVINASYNEVFYESFENNGDSFTNPKTGKKVHSGDYTVNLPTANSKSKLTYWYWQNNTWYYKEVPYSGGNYLITDGEYIDEVRIYPAGALLTTYTYSPSVGVTSVTNHNGQVTSYEYDSFGRLTVVKDNLGNIIQQTQYNVTNNPTYEP